MTEQIIKSKLRVQKHGEVFTPRRIVNQMLDTPEIKEACENLTATFLEMIMPPMIQFNRAKRLDIRTSIERRCLYMKAFV